MEQMNFDDTDMNDFMQAGSPTMMPQSEGPALVSQGEFESSDPFANSTPEMMSGFNASPVQVENDLTEEE